MRATALELLQDDQRRFDLARRGHEIFARRRLPEIMARAIAETEAALGEFVTAKAELGPETPGTSLSRIEPSRARREEKTDGTPGRLRLKAKQILFHAINGNGLGHVDPPFRNRPFAANRADVEHSFRRAPLRTNTRPASSLRSIIASMTASS